MKEQKSNPMARIWEIAKPEHGRLLLSVVLAVLGVVSGIVPFVSAAKIISGMISGNGNGAITWYTQALPLRALL